MLALGGSEKLSPATWRRFATAGIPPSQNFRFAMTMLRRSLLSVLCCCGLLLFAAADWLQFRGTHNDGVAEGAAPPAEFAIAQDGQPAKNVAWQAEVPGRGVSGPIVVDGRVIVTSSSGYRRDRLHVLAYDVKSGEQLWERQFWATGRTFCHPTSSVAAPTAASDGQRIFAFYSSNDLACLDLDGNLLWYRGLGVDHPQAGNDVGMSSSPLVVGDTVIVQVEGKGDSFAAGIDTTTGETKWRIARPREMNWVSPTILRGKSREEDLVLLQNTQEVSAHVPASGEKVWGFEIQGNPIPSAVATRDLVVVPADGLTVFRRAEDSNAVEKLWQENELGPGSSSPIIKDENAYVLRGTLLMCVEAETGDKLWECRLKGSRFWATPVLAGDRIYTVADGGLCQVVDISGDEGTVVAEIELGEPVLGTPAIADGSLYIRGDKHLWKIAE